LFRLANKVDGNATASRQQQRQKNGRYQDCQASAFTVSFVVAHAGIVAAAAADCNGPLLLTLAAASGR